MELHAVGQQRLHRRRAAAEGHMRRLPPGALQEEHRRVMGGGAVAGAGIGQRLARGSTRAPEGEELLDGGDRQRGMRHQDQRHGAELGDRREGAAVVEGQVLHEVRRRGVGRRVEEQRVPVIGLRHCGRRDGARRAGPVLQHQGLAERLAHGGRDQPRHGVDRAAGREADDRADRPVRPGRLGERGQWQRGAGGSQQQPAAAGQERSGHGAIPGMSCCAGYGSRPSDFHPRSRQGVLAQSAR